MTQKKPSLSQKALRVRARAKAKKPKFVRAESWKYDRFSVAWRKPRGLDNKIRRKILGWPPGPCTGYKGPKVARYLHPSGYNEVLVYNVNDLGSIDVNTQAARIAHTVGKRKRADIIAHAKDMNIKILNVKLTVEEEETEEAAEGEEIEEAAAEDKETKQKAPAKKTKKPKEQKKQEKKAPKKKAKPKEKKKQ
jgi:large subunit ribosomal protein L32e